MTDIDLELAKMTERVAVDLSEGRRVFIPNDFVDEVVKGIDIKDEKGIVYQSRITPFITVCDVIRQALSGSDTIASLCQHIFIELDMLSGWEALILSHSCEQVQHIAQVMHKVGHFTGVREYAYKGGTIKRLDEQQNVVACGRHVLVGTPGGILNEVKSQSLNLDSLKMCVLVEADKMLLCGFKDQIYDLFKVLPLKAQRSLYSFTSSPELFEMTKMFMNEPVRILLECNEPWYEEEFIAQESKRLKKGDENGGMKSFYISMPKEEMKWKALCSIYETLDAGCCIVFVETPSYVKWLAFQMSSRGFEVFAAHSEMDQNERESIVRDFRSGSCRMLITDALSVRVQDLQQVSLVIYFYCMPDKEISGHSVSDWRRGRFGREGIVLSFLTEEEERLLSIYGSFYNVVVVELSRGIFLQLLKI